MNTNYIKALRNVFLAVVSPLVTSETAVPNNTQPDNVNESDILANTATTRSKSPMLLLKPSSDGSSWDFSGHYSHRSHSSHRSHYSSSYSTSSGSTKQRSSSSYASPSGTYVKSKGKTHSTRKISPYHYVPVIINTSLQDSTITRITLAHPEYKLGDRVIKPSFKGFDVTEMILILQKEGYIIIDGNKMPRGDSVYEGVLIQAIREFQRNNKIHPSGIVRRNTIKKLLKLRP